MSLLASWEEGFGQVLLEGACADLPAVVVADSGFADRVHGWGSVADEPTGASVADALRAAATIPAGAARRWAETHGPDTWADQHLTLLEQLVEAHRLNA